MASLTNNPYKKFKKSLKGAKMMGSDVHSFIKNKLAKKATKKTGSFEGKSNKLGQGGRAAQMKAQGVPGGVIGMMARKVQAAPGQKNFHKKTKKMKASMSDMMAMKKAKKGVTGMSGNKKMKGAPSTGHQSGAMGLKEMKKAKKK